jgi:Peptidase family M23
MRIRRRFKVAVALLAALGLATLVLLVAFAVAVAGLAAAAWRPPVPGALMRPFDPGSHPFESGRHRGIDLAARPGTTVRAPCAGRVAFAGLVGTSGRVVTLRCGVWRVTHMPLASIAVRTGATVREGAPLGTVAASREHAGLHLGVRRDGTRFGYADPLRFLAPEHPPPSPLGRAPRPPRSAVPPPRHTARPRPVAAPRPVAPPGPIVAPRPVAAPRPIAPPAPVAAPAPAGSNRGLRPPFAPWPAWLGLALVLAGAGLRLRARPRTARGRVPAAGTVMR